jgi:site-specific DNA-cytosine methylase
VQTYKVLHLFSGIGGAALGFQEARQEYRGMLGQFETRPYRHEGKKL